MNEQGRQDRSCPRIPELDEVVFRAGREQALRRVPLDALDVPAVSCTVQLVSNETKRRGKGSARTGQHPLFLHPLKVPHLDHAVVRAGDEALVVRRPTRVSDRLVVTLENLEVVHVLLEVLDDAGVVGGEEPLARVRPREGADGRVMGLRGGDVSEAFENAADKGPVRTCRIVSKLNVKPFHSVNSPLVEPVRMRRASGVNWQNEDRQ